MTGEEIKRTKIMNLVQRLYIIDAKLNGETSQLVSEYNEVLYDLWVILGGVELKTDPPKIKSLRKENE